MALLPTTALETHPVNTAGLNGIVNANWAVIEAIFLPIVGMVNGGQIQWDASAKRFKLRISQAVLAYSGTPAIDLAAAMTQTLALTGIATFTTSNRTAGARVTIIITCDGTGRALTWPAGWKWIGATAPATIAANKTAILELISTTSLDTGMVARWTVEA